MMNKSLRAGERESSRKTFYGFQRGDKGVPNRTAAMPPAAFARKNGRPDISFAQEEQPPCRRLSPKKEPPFLAALKLITGRRQTE
jgi:hypothetical protein